MVVFQDTFANVQNVLFVQIVTSRSSRDYEALVAELNCLSDAKDDVIAEYAAAGREFVDEFEDVLLERA